MNFPKAQIDIHEGLVRELVDSQFPEFSDYSIRFLSEGYDNSNYKLGNSYLIRLPRRKLGAELIKHEIEWLPKLGYKLPIQIPSPKKVGAPTNAYPWSWTIVPFFDGHSALEKSLDEPEIKRFVQFLKKLHHINPEGVPENPYRNVPLSEKSKSVARKNEHLESGSMEIKNLWEQTILEPIDCKPSLIHGDLHPDNIIINNGKIEAVIDWGDITKGDPATDLASLWMLIEDPGIRDIAFEKYGASDSTILRSKGWAIFYGINFLTIPKYKALGNRILTTLT